MPERSTARKLWLSEAFHRKQSRPIDEFHRGNLPASFQFDAQHPQIGCAPATNHHRVSLNQQCSWSCGLALGRILPAEVIRRRLAPNVTSVAAERGVGARPGREAADPIEDFL